MPIQSSFCVSGVKTEFSEKKITIETNFKINSSTVNLENIKLYNVVEEKMNIIVPSKMYVEDSNIILILDKYPKKDDNYYLIVKNLKDKLNRDLYNIYDRYVTFDYEPIITIDILIPTDQQVFKTKDVEIKIAISDESEETKYRFEISSDIAFSNADFIILKDSFGNYDLSNKEQYTLVDSKKDANNLNLLINFKDDGQYYLRVRAEMSDSSFGSWSEIATFKVASNAPSQDSTGYLDDFFSSQEIFKEEFTELKLLNKTPDATTAKIFYIEFNKKIQYSQDLESKYSQEGLLYIGKAYLVRRDI